ncbi:aspartate racemase [Fictibacillus macauensis ZFHKF-1]|uniref:Aspartate racemase n=1 Tax=Fictibacillus macauensis ZFHKF-1 TaxID=1196324 RepID=I8IW51_9BACL|nr:aspartate/glutamate racemase family protein [Fictibacillus macauensis]EIT83716.1 aspartate racemase [Fictibacillus macauensis ZFHKF-1]
MKTIGMLGGMSWESTAIYYKVMNERVKQRLGGLHSAKCLLSSVDFEEMAQLQADGDWQGAGELLGKQAAALEQAGADFLIICTNTMHSVIPTIKRFVSLPFLHIAEATATRIQQASLSKVGLLGTRYTMEQDFYSAKIEEAGIEVMIPSEQERQDVHRIIYEELCLGHQVDSSRARYQEIIRSLQARGAEGIILGCTEIGLLISESDVELPLFDTAVIHAEEAVERALLAD